MWAINPTDFVVGRKGNGLNKGMKLRENFLVEMPVLNIAVRARGWPCVPFILMWMRPYQVQIN
jgi:hypothetical protein